MPRLPNVDHAVIDRRKLEYCLDPSHPTGRHKARVFGSALGLNAGDADELERILREVLQSHSASRKGMTPLGDELWVVESEMRCRCGPMRFITAWATDPRAGVPRLVSCYLKGMK